MDLSKAIIYGIMLLSSTSMASEIVYSTGFCEPSEMTVTIKNKTPEMQRAWSQVRIDDEIQEQHFDLAGGAQIQIPGDRFLSGKQGFAFKTWDKKSLSITASCAGSLNYPLTDTTSPEVTHYLPSGITTVKLQLMNLFLKAQTVKLRGYGKFGNLLEQKEITIEKYYDTSALKWNFSEEVLRLEIIGEQRLHSLLVFEEKNLEKISPALPKIVSFSPAADKNYFMVSTKGPNPEESFVIALSDLQQVATAREQIQNKQLEKIIVARIELGHGGYNRALSAKDKSPYSWSVYHVDAFADFAHIDCDGSPDLTEERLPQKLSEGGGRICFWRYRIIKELSAEEVAFGKVR
ncbi:BP74-related protein [Bdellovibrio reynosensis]|uniref:BP74 N-terminal domain-containing protein n=1 Tax=Bdellovibrio reynosensis TaxID=2835041 RepID=A0ABY4CEY7_9BACT|nr:hypothetical protein [Bdellovibrio reynosensis]UOF02113.1 hypothetical protein MNR06_03985 [Bdellovibrio reynosensis]